MAKRLNVLITSGGTKVAIDSVRHIGNMSSGTFGSKIAYEALRAGQRVTFLMAEGSKSPLGLRFDEKDSIWAVVLGVLHNILDRLLYMHRLQIRTYTSFYDYESSLNALVAMGQFDVVVLAAAASDFGVANAIAGKLRSKEEMNIKLFPLPKLISQVRSWTPVNRACDLTLVGFKLLVNSTDTELQDAAYGSLAENRCDLVVANDLRDIKEGAHRLTLVSRVSGTSIVPPNPDDPNSLARAVVDRYMRIEKWKHRIEEQKSY